MGERENELDDLAGAGSEPLADSHEMPADGQVAEGGDGRGVTAVQGSDDMARRDEDLAGATVDDLQGGVEENALDVSAHEDAANERRIRDEARRSGELGGENPVPGGQDPGGEGALTDEEGLEVLEDQETG